MAEKTAKGNPLTRGERLQIMLDNHEMSAVDDFRFSHRMPSRAAAIRELLRRGLAAEGFTVGRASARSQSYSVIDRSPSNGNGGPGNSAE